MNAPREERGKERTEEMNIPSKPTKRTRKKRNRAGNNRRDRTDRAIVIPSTTAVFPCIVGVIMMCLSRLLVCSVSIMSFEACLAVIPAREESS
jgi:hypothetical protein